jgi:uncharacterized protein with GYD domain
MPTYVALVNWTDQGIAAFRDSPKRADAFAKVLQQAGGKVRDIYWTIGPHDIVVIADAPDDETMTAALLQVGALGNIRTTTLRAFTKREFADIAKRAAG